jgi:hypothetical protein
LREFAGEPLETILARGGPLPLATVAGVVERMADALAGAQAAGQVPPELQGLLAACNGRAMAESVDPLDAAAAQLWLAALAYNLLTGHPVSPSQVRQSVPKPIRAYRPEVAAEAEAAVFRGLTSGPQRFSSVKEFASALRQAASARLEQDEEERTSVSSVPSGIAAQIRLSGALLPNDEQTVVSPSAGNDELTVVSPGGGGMPSWPGEPPSVLGLSEDRLVSGPVSVASMFTPTQQMPRVAQRPPSSSRNVWIGVGAFVLVAGALVTWRVVAGHAPQPVAAPARVVRPAAAAAVAAAQPPAPARIPPPPPAPPPAPVIPPAPPEPAAPALEPEIAPAAAEHPSVPVPRGRPTRAHLHARASSAAPAPAPAPAPAADAPRSCRLSVASYPWAELWVDGADTGLQTPVVKFAISCGRHRLEFKRRDRNVDQVESVTLTEGTEFKRQYELRGAELDD